MHNAFSHKGTEQKKKQGGMKRDSGWRVREGEGLTFLSSLLLFSLSRLTSSGADQTWLSFPPSPSFSLCLAG